MILLIQLLIPLGLVPDGGILHLFFVGSLVLFLLNWYFLIPLHNNTVNTRLVDLSPSICQVAQFLGTPNGLRVRPQCVGFSTDICEAPSCFRAVKILFHLDTNVRPKCGGRIEVVSGSHFARCPKLDLRPLGLDPPSLSPSGHLTISGSKVLFVCFLTSYCHFLATYATESVQGSQCKYAVHPYTLYVS